MDLAEIDYADRTKAVDAKFGLFGLWVMMVKSFGFLDEKMTYFSKRWRLWRPVASWGVDGFG